MKLLPKEDLEYSPVVANNRMNRERGLLGVNSYEKDLGVNLLEELMLRTQTEKAVRWMDFCCGSGKALIEAAEQLENKQLGEKVELEGLDLVGMFDSFSQTQFPFLKLQIGSVIDWQADHKYDLITCVHGIHYVGDKLSFIRKTIQCLKPDGMFLAHLDPDNLRDASGNSFGKILLKEWEGLGCEFVKRKHLLICKKPITLPRTWEYLGADDQAGPNYTGQEAVNSYYRNT